MHYAALAGAWNILMAIAFGQEKVGKTGCSERSASINPIATPPPGWWLTHALMSCCPRPATQAPTNGIRRIQLRTEACVKPFFGYPCCLGRSHREHAQGGIPGVAPQERLTLLLAVFGFDSSSVSFERETKHRVCIVENHAFPPLYGAIDEHAVAFPVQMSLLA